MMAWSGDLALATVLVDGTLGSVDEVVAGEEVEADGEATVGVVLAGA